MHVRLCSLRALLGTSARGPRHLLGTAPGPYAQWHTRHRQDPEEEDGAAHTPREAADGREATQRRG